MRGQKKHKLGFFSLGALLVSMACAMPYGIGVNRSPENSVVRAGATIPASTNTPTAMPTYTTTATRTPLPTSTATLVVPPTATPTAVSGASQASASLGGEATTESQVTKTAVAAASPISQPLASSENVITNGDFEASWPDFEPVAAGWFPFDNGNAHVGWYKDTWTKVVFDGTQAQMIEIINDQNVGDRYAGVFQTVTVVAGAEYELTIHGLVRSDEGSAGVSGSGYILQYGIDYDGGADWQAVTKWIDLPFPEYPREDPNASNVYNYGTYTTKITPTGNRLTLFIRAWKKWPDLFEGNFDIDAISLQGTGVQTTPTPTATATEPPSETATPTPTALVEMPESGGQVETKSSSVVVWIISLISLAILLAGAVLSIVKRRAN